MFVCGNASLSVLRRDPGEKKLRHVIISNLHWYVPSNQDMAMTKDVEIILDLYKQGHNGSKQGLKQQFSRASNWTPGKSLDKSDLAIVILTSRKTT